MSRPFVVSIAGFDPSAGAGVLADVKTFEQHQVQHTGDVLALGRLLAQEHAHEASL